MFQKIKKILGLAIVVLALFVNAAFAETNKIDKTSHNKASSATKTIKTENVGDPDLKLSIEELKKKYPISLLDEKKKSYKAGQKINIDDYSIEEIKAAFLNADRNFVSRMSLKEAHTVEMLNNDVKAKSQLELDIIDESCNEFAWVGDKPKKHQIMRLFLFSSKKIQEHIARFIPIKSENCFTQNDPFELEYRD